MSVTRALEYYKDNYEVPLRPPLSDVLAELRPLYNVDRTPEQEEKFNLLNNFRQEYYE